MEVKRCVSVLALALTCLVPVLPGLSDQARASGVAGAKANISTNARAGANASAVGSETIRVKLAIGLGYHICAARSNDKLPPLQEAFLCEGLLASPQTVEIELERKPARKPSWLFYEASYDETTGFKSTSSTLQLNVAYAEIEGVKYAYVDGRLISNTNGKKTEPIYFRFSSEGGFSNLQYSSTYGARVPMLVGGEKAEYAPYVAIQAAR